MEAGEKRAESEKGIFKNWFFSFVFSLGVGGIGAIVGLILCPESSIKGRILLGVFLAQALLLLGWSIFYFSNLFQGPATVWEEAKWRGEELGVLFIYFSPPILVSLLTYLLSLLFR